MSNYFASLLLSLTIVYSYSSTPVVLKNDGSYRSMVAADFDIFCDSTNQLSAKEVLKLDSSAFINNRSQEPLYSNDYLGKNLWLKFSISDLDSTTNWWYLEFPDFHISTIEVFMVDTSNNIISQGIQGYLHPFDQRPLNYKNPIYKIDATKSNHYLIRLNSEIGTSYKVQLVHPSVKFSYSIKEYLDYGIYYGILSFLILYNLIVFLSVRDKSYLFYVLYIFFYLVQSLLNDGIGFQYLWPSLPILNRIYDLNLLVIMIIFGFYSNSFLSLKERFPKAQKWLKYAILSYTIFFFIFAYTNQIHQVNNWLVIVPFAVISYTTFKLYKQGYKDVRFFIVGYSFLLLGVIVSVLMRARIIVDSGLTIYSMEYGLLLEAFFLSLAMGDKMKQNNQKLLLFQQAVIDEKSKNEELQQKVNRELEQKIAERTEEISSKNKELELLTQQLNTFNSELDKNVWKLNKDLKEIFKKGVLQDRVSFQEFTQIFPDESSCKNFLKELKWKNGFQCKKCGNTKWHDVESSFVRKCSKCNLKESITAHTVFHRLRLPLNNAMYIVYITTYFDGKVKLEKLAEDTGLSKSSISLFRTRVREKIKTIKSAEPTLEMVIL